MDNILISAKLELLPLLLSQTDSNGGTGFFSTQALSSEAINWAKALVLLLAGAIVAAIAKSIASGILKRTNIDNRISSWVAGSEGNNALAIEKWLPEIVFWLILLFAVVAFLNAINLPGVSAPLNALLERVTTFLPRVAGAGVLLSLAWLLATIVKLLAQQTLSRVGIDQKVNRQITDTPDEKPLRLSETIANALYWFIFLLFLPSILSTLELAGTLTPVQQLVDNILAIVPNIFAAVLIGAVGWLIAQVVRKVVTNLLSATGVDQVGAKFGLVGTTGTKSLSWIIGTLVYILVLIPTAIAALNALEIRAISDPAISMLNQVLNLLPKLFAAAVVLILAYMAGRYISELVTSILTGIGFNNIFQWLGLSRTPTVSTTPINAVDSATTLQDVEIDNSTVLQSDQKGINRTPSELVGLIVLIAIMLVATLTAVDILQIEALKTLVGGIMLIAGQVLVGLVIFAIGLYLANVAFNLIAASGGSQARILGHTARISIITLVSAMALQQMGIAPSIINLAFGLLVGGIAVAIALAFGLGGRDIAAEQVREWLNSFKNKS